MARRVSVSESELKKIPFLDAANIAGRVVTTLCFWERGEWHMWLPHAAGVIKLRGEPAEADYFARMPEKGTDIYLEFLNFLTQRACWRSVMRPVDGIRADIHNLGASLGKIALFRRACTERKQEVRRFVATEMEYIFLVCRSVFDLLQEVVHGLWDRVVLLDKASSKQQLRETFGRMVISGCEPLDIEGIQAKFHIPEALASFYHRQAPFFQTLRDYRDRIVHGGMDFDLIFATERGFGLRCDSQPFASFGVWQERQMLRDHLAPLRPVLAYVITRTIEACEDFSLTMQRLVRFPPEIAPGFKLFVRGFHNDELIAMKQVIKDCLW